jgi:hypothetical protein
MVRLELARKAPPIKENYVTISMKEQVELTHIMGCG